MTLTDRKPLARLACFFRRSRSVRVPDTRRQAEGHEACKKCCELRLALDAEDGFARAVTREDLDFLFAEA